MDLYTLVYDNNFPLHILQTFNLPWAEKLYCKMILHTAAFWKAKAVAFKA
jgi:hypothetical protein